MRGDKTWEEKKRELDEYADRTYGILPNGHAQLSSSSEDDDDTVDFANSKLDIVTLLNRRRAATPKTPFAEPAEGKRREDADSISSDDEDDRASARPRKKVKVDGQSKALSRVKQEAEPARKGTRKAKDKVNGNGKDNGKGKRKGGGKKTNTSGRDEEEWKRQDLVGEVDPALLASLLPPSSGEDTEDEKKTRGEEKKWARKRYLDQLEHEKRLDDNEDGDEPIRLDASFTSFDDAKQVLSKLPGFEFLND